MPIISSGHGTISFRRSARIEVEAAPELKSAVQPLMAALRGGRGNGFSRYGYLFPDLANDERASLLSATTPQETHAKLLELAEALAQIQDVEEATGELAAVYTYFGQFLNHDISAPLLRSHLDRPDDDGAVESLSDLKTLDGTDRPRTIAEIVGPDDQTRPVGRRVLINQHPLPMILNSLYGEDPLPGERGADTNRFYEPGTARFALGETVRLSDRKLKNIAEEVDRLGHNPGPNDIPRDPEQRIALIADPRNDENLIISQLHLAFLKFHNKVVEWLDPKPGADLGRVFDEARRLTTLHYQWCIVHDYLGNLLDAEVYRRAMRDLAGIEPLDRVPMEFAAAVFRFGHSMVSSIYDYNANFSQGGPAGRAGLSALFDFTSRQGLNGNDRLPDHWVADWTMLATISKSDRIDPFLVGMLLGLKDTRIINLTSIASRNLLRGFHRRIPSGQLLAKAARIEPVSREEMAIATADGEGLDRFLRKSGFDAETPPWFYVLCEAKAKADGNRLGPMASEIVARTILGLLRGNPRSVLGDEGRGWNPDAPRGLRTADGGAVNDIKSFLQFAGVMA
jgi:hypothetical protein